jgi:hypothetical protein
METPLNVFACFGDEILLLIGAAIIYFVVSNISHFIKARRGNQDKYWEKYWSAKRLAEEERMKDPSYKSQKVWDEQEERNKENQRQMVREVITATGRYKHRSPMTKDEVIGKIRADEWPFSKWMLTEFLDGSLMSGDLSGPVRIRRKIAESVRKVI